MTAALVPVVAPVVVAGEVVKSVAGVIDTWIKADAAIQVAREQTKQCEAQAQVMLAQIAAGRGGQITKHETLRLAMAQVGQLVAMGRYTSEDGRALMSELIARIKDEEVR